MWPDANTNSLTDGVQERSRDMLIILRWRRNGVTQFPDSVLPQPFPSLPFSCFSEENNLVFFCSASKETLLPPASSSDKGGRRGGKKHIILVQPEQIQDTSLVLLSFLSAQDHYCCTWRLRGVFALCGLCVPTLKTFKGKWKKYIYLYI